MAEITPGEGRFKVVGDVAVVKILDGSERYLYRGAQFSGTQVDAARVRHLVDVGLIEKLAEPAPADTEAADAAKAAADAKAKADAASAAKAKAAAAKAAASKPGTAATGE